MYARAKSRLAERADFSAWLSSRRFPIPSGRRGSEKVKKKDRKKGRKKESGVEKKLTVCCKKVEWLRTLAGLRLRLCLRPVGSLFGC